MSPETPPAAGMTSPSPATTSTQGGISIFKLLEAPAKARFETLSDGIFAVAMTILVLDLKLPQLPHDVSSTQMFLALFALWPKVGAFVISFLFLAKTWDVQRLVIHAVERVDYPFVVMNVLLLLVCCFLPFSTSLVAEYPHVSFAAVVYLANMIALPCFNYAMWLHATRKHRLVKKDIDPAVVQWFGRNHQLLIAVYSVAFPIAYFSPELSILWIFLFQIVMHILPFVSEKMSGQGWTE
jgi:uncharacterized membrane protein